MNTRCPPKRVPSVAHFFTLCSLAVQPSQSYSVGGQRSSGQITGKPAGTRPDYRGRWCAVSQGHPGRPNPPDARPIERSPLELPSTVGCGIASTRTGDVRSAHRYHLCADSGGAKMNTRCPPKRVPSVAHFFTLCSLAVQPSQSYSVGGQRSSGQITGKPAGTRPDYRGRWCAVSQGHPGRPNPPDARPIERSPLELPSTVGCGIASTRTGDVQAIKRILHSSDIARYTIVLTQTFLGTAHSALQLYPH
ncbi:UNVERIFIED_CONTAM: hypothetical protein FKN15_067037 [Acipenser sinensis]